MRNYSKPRGIIRTGPKTPTFRSNISHPKGNLGYFYNLQPPPRYSERLYKIKQQPEYGFSRYGAAQEYVQRQEKHKQDYNDYIQKQQADYIKWRALTNLRNLRRNQWKYHQYFGFPSRNKSKPGQLHDEPQESIRKTIYDQVINAISPIPLPLSRPSNLGDVRYVGQPRQPGRGQPSTPFWDEISRRVISNLARRWPGSPLNPPREPSTPDDINNNKQPCMHYNVWKKTWLPCSQNFLQTKRRKFYNAYETPYAQRQHRTSNRSRRYYRTYQFTTNSRNTFAYRGYRRYNNRRLRKQQYYSIY